MLALWRLRLDDAALRATVTTALGAALLLTAIVLLLRHRLLARYRGRMRRTTPQVRAALTLLTGAVLGSLISLSSVGAGAIGATALILLHPELPPARIVGSDIAHAVPLTLIPGFFHWTLGSVDGALLGSLLIGSLPGIVIGSHASLRVPDGVLRPALATVLLLVGGRLLF